VPSVERHVLSRDPQPANDVYGFFESVDGFAGAQCGSAVRDDVLPQRLCARAEAQLESPAAEPI
jgi:hypothetical protein